MPVAELNIPRIRARDFSLEHKGKTYLCQVRKCEEGGFFAEVLECPGCRIWGDTEEETKIKLLNALKLWLAASQN